MEALLSIKFQNTVFKNHNSVILLYFAWNIVKDLALKDLSQEQSQFSLKETFSSVVHFPLCCGCI